MVAGATLELGHNAQLLVKEDFILGPEPAPTLHLLTAEQIVRETVQRPRNAIHNYALLMEVGVISELGLPAQKHAEEELRQGLEPAPTLLQLMVEQIVTVMLNRNKHATFGIAGLTRSNSHVTTT